MERKLTLIHSVMVVAVSFLSMNHPGSSLYLVEKLRGRGRSFELGRVLPEPGRVSSYDDTQRNLAR